MEKIRRIVNWHIVITTNPYLLYGYEKKENMDEYSDYVCRDIIDICHESDDSGLIYIYTACDELILVQLEEMNYSDMRQEVEERVLFDPDPVNKSELENNETIKWLIENIKNDMELSEEFAEPDININDRAIFSDSEDNASHRFVLLDCYALEILQEKKQMNNDRWL